MRISTLLAPLFVLAGAVSGQACGVEGAICENVVCDGRLGMCEPSYCSGGTCTRPICVPPSKPCPVSTFTLESAAM